MSDIHSLFKILLIIFPEKSPVKGMPVLFAPCKPGARPNTHILELQLPCPATGLQKYEGYLICIFFK